MKDKLVIVNTTLDEDYPADYPPDVRWEIVVEQYGHKVYHIHCPEGNSQSEYESYNVARCDTTKWLCGGCGTLVPDEVVTMTRLLGAIGRKQTERFWSKVDKSGGCWAWTASKRDGYGQLTVARKIWKAQILLDYPFWHDSRWSVCPT